MRKIRIDKIMINMGNCRCEVCASVVAYEEERWWGDSGSVSELIKTKRKLVLPLPSRLRLHRSCLLYLICVV